MKQTTLSGSSLPKRNAIANFFITKRNLIIEIISALFILLFAYTAINKFISISSLKAVLKEYPLIGGMPVLVAWALPLTETVVAILLFIPRFRLIGLYASLILLSGFTLYLGYMLAFTPNLPCTCGGMLQKLSWFQHLIFNILFVLLAITGILLNKRSFAQKKESETTQVLFT